MLVTKFPTHRKDDQVAKLDEQDGVLNVVPLKMIVPVYFLNTRAKNVDFNKNKATEMTVGPPVEHHVEPFVEPLNEPTTKSTIDIHIFNTYLNGILNKGHGSTKDPRDQNPQNEEPRVQGK
ncbi:unnamed protein product [Vicia faba]|uniref:Uncharacterized protein n=1 Tax=Vicia faba TaxID=3906 RepID=A0AAV0YYN3_VICFA|nr:unnamed protein product [Vicia faba]